MKVLIIEDEFLAARQLERLLKRHDPDITVLEQLDTVRAAVEYFKKGGRPDLAFFVIRLADGLSMEIFQQVNVPCPVIFTTAYDQYALEAFQVNGISYLLKPLSYPALEAAFQKLKMLQQVAPPVDHQTLTHIIQQMQRPKYKNRFLVKQGQQLVPLAETEVAALFSEHKLSWLLSREGKKYNIQDTLEQVSPQLDPDQFFRINRTYLVHRDAIEKIYAFSNSRLRLEIKGFSGVAEDLVVSRERVQAFKVWMDF